MEPQTILHSYQRDGQGTPSQFIPTGVPSLSTATGNIYMSIYIEI